MAKTGGWFKKLRDKQRKHAVDHKLGTQRAIITRNATPHAEKVIAFEAHKRLIVVHGFNPQPTLTYIKRTGPAKAVTFRGDGLVDDSLQALKPAKTSKERADADKRKPLTSEMRGDWKPRGFGCKKYGRQSGSYLA